MPTVSVKINHETKIFNISEQKTLFDEIQNKGLELPHGCLAGSCGSCKIWVTAGKENFVPPSAVESDTLMSIQKTVCQTKGADYFKDKYLRLSCRAKIKGDISIEPAIIN